MVPAPLDVERNQIQTAGTVAISRLKEVILDGRCEGIVPEVTVLGYQASHQVINQS